MHTSCPSFLLVEHKFVLLVPLYLHFYFFFLSKADFFCLFKAEMLMKLSKSCQGASQAPSLVLWQVLVALWLLAMFVCSLVLLELLLADAGLLSRTRRETEI